MTKDVNEAVLDAFRVEHREQLEQIRTLVGKLRPGDRVVQDARIQDAFRFAHSFKGGARVCDLREAEQLGHGLETILEKLHRGELAFTENVVDSVHLLLDSIEDWMAALEEEQPLPDTATTLAAVKQLFSACSAPDAPASGAASRAAQLRSAFNTEYEQHSTFLREFLTRWDGNCDAGNDLQEAARAAHTLAGAAAIVALRSVEAAARDLEGLLRAIQRGERRLDGLARQQFERALETMAAAMQESSQSPDQFVCTSQSATCGAFAGAVPENGDARASKPLQPASASESVRVSIDSLDRLVNSCSQILNNNQRMTRLAHQLSSLQQDVSELDRERDALRRTASSNLHKLSMLPEYGRIVRYVEYVDRQIGNLAKAARQVGLEHRRAVWQSQARAAQLQRDVYAARLVPAHSLFQGFRKMVREMAKSLGKQIDFQMSGLDVRADRMVLQELKDPIMHLLRNCVTHGIEPPEERRSKGKQERGRVALAVEVSGGRLSVAIDDDGQGIDVEQIQRQAVERGFLNNGSANSPSAREILAVLFESGFSTVEVATELAGRGMGLSIVRDAVVRLQGEVSLLPRREGGVRAQISVPTFVSTHRVLLVACGDQLIGIPTRGIERLLRIAKDKIETIEGQPIVMYQRRPVRLVQLSDVLGYADSDSRMEAVLSIVLLKSGARLLGVSVDGFIDDRDALLANFDEFAESEPWAGGVLLDDGRAALVLQPRAIVEGAPVRASGFAAKHEKQAEPTAPGKVLIVDDSFTTRTLEKSILEAQGYAVSVAVDGVEALAQLREQKYALVISDIEMPRMDGFALLERIKSEQLIADTPVILVTSRDRPEDQQRGLDLGANAYIVKRKFDHQELLNTVGQLI
ncbi:MAG TPA: response regulator [Lacipirellulaceae bacterium]|nr:response regulator [Lacipirellulaceae bacterium]